MTDDRLRELVRGPEGPRVEFKEAVNRDRVKRTAVAFANRLFDPEPGVLFIGVKDNGTVCGVSNPDEAQRELRRYVEECYPRIPEWEVRPLAVANLMVIALIVPESRIAPHFVGGAYIRHGSESVEASDLLYEQILAHRKDSARLLGPFVGSEVVIEQEVTDHRHGRIWSETRPHRKLLRVDAIGVTLEVPSSSPLTADWSRVRLQPLVPNAPPYLRIALD